MVLQWTSENRQYITIFYNFVVIAVAFLLEENQIAERKV